MIEQKIKPKVPLVDIHLNINNFNDVEKEEYLGTLGDQPVVYFNGLHINVADIKTLNINNFNFSPSLELVINDSLGVLDDSSYPLDNSIISIYIDSKSTVYKEIRLDFKIMIFDLIKKGSRSSIFFIKGEINCDYLFLQDNIALSKMTSYNALEQIAKDSGLGFVSNVSSTNDEMTWINPNLKGSEFIQSIVKRSYIQDDSFLWVFIDMYNNINLIDVEEILGEEVKNDNVLPIRYKKNNEEIITDITLTNDEGFSNSNVYFNSYQILNRSTEMSIESGYRRRVHMYDTSGNWESKAGSFLIFDLDSINSPGSEKNKIILKSSQLGEDFYKKNIKTEYLGKLDIDNVHLDYLYSTSQNSHNINNIQKIALKLILSTPNFSITRYQKVNVAISNQGTSITKSHINNRLSGEWTVIGTGFEFSKRNGYKLEQVLTLVRRELNPDI